MFVCACARFTHTHQSVQTHAHTQHTNTSKHTFPSINSHYAFHNLFRQVTNTCIVACCSVVQGVAGCCDNNALQQHNAKQAIHCNTLSLSISQFAPTSLHASVNTLQHTATHCNTLQHPAPHFNTLSLCISQFVPTRMHQWPHRLKIFRDT